MRIDRLIVYLTRSFGGGAAEVVRHCYFVGGTGPWVIPVAQALLYIHLSRMKSCKLDYGTRNIIADRGIYCLQGFLPHSTISLKVVGNQG